MLIRNESSLADDNGDDDNDVIMFVETKQLTLNRFTGKELKQIKENNNSKSK